MRNDDTAIQRIGVVEFHPAQRERFQSGELAREWAANYPKLFDEDDLRLALSQPVHHFFEWLREMGGSAGWRSPRFRTQSQ